MKQALKKNRLVYYYCCYYYYQSLLLFAGQQWALENKQQGSSLLLGEEHRIKEQNEGKKTKQNIETLRRINLLHSSILQTQDTPSGQRSTKTKNQKYNQKTL